MKAPTNFKLVKTPMENITIYVDSEYSSEIESLVKQVESDAIVKHGVLSVLGNEEAPARSKDIVPIIIASSAAAAALLFSISKLLDSYFNRSHIFEWDELEEVKENGELVKDQDGNPIWKTKRKQALMSPERLKDTSSIEFSAGLKGVLLKISSSKK